MMMRVLLWLMVSGTILLMAAKDCSGENLSGSGSGDIIENLNTSSKDALPLASFTYHVPIHTPPVMSLPTSSTTEAHFTTSSYATADVSTFASSPTPLAVPDESSVISLSSTLPSLISTSGVFIPLTGSPVIPLPTPTSTAAIKTNSVSISASSTESLESPSEFPPPNVPLFTTLPSPSAIITPTSKLGVPVATTTRSHTTSLVLPVSSVTYPPSPSDTPSSSLHASVTPSHPPSLTSSLAPSPSPSPSPITAPSPSPSPSSSRALLHPSRVSESSLSQTSTLPDRFKPDSSSSATTSVPPPPTTTPPPVATYETPSPSPSEDTFRLWLLIGLIVVAVVLILFLCVLICICLWYRSRERGEYDLTKTRNLSYGRSYMEDPLPGLSSTDGSEDESPRGVQIQLKQKFNSVLDSLNRRVNLLDNLTSIGNAIEAGPGSATEDDETSKL